MKQNEEIKKYYNILCNGNYPSFINKYLKVKELERLKEIGQFCGCDYNKLYNIKYWYSRYDHSIAVALMTWNFTKDKTQTIAALFHDLGTPAFSHCIDYLLGDSVKQESSEKSVFEIINKSIEIKKLLEEDNINIDDVTDLSKYPIIENKSPKLCTDRLEGVLHTVLVWANSWPLEKVEEVYKSLIVLVNEDNKPEIGFKNLKSAEEFFKAVYEYSILLQCNENKFTVQYTADSIRKLIDINIISVEDLYILSEKEIIKLLNINIPTWNIYVSTNKIIRTDIKPKNRYFVSVESKKRNVIPLCKYKNLIVRLDKVSKKTRNLLEFYGAFKDSKYCYMIRIK